MTQTRSINDYFGKIVTATHPAKKITIENFFQCVGEFNLFSDRLSIEIPDWTVESFESFGEPLGIFTKNYPLFGADWTEFYNANQTLVETVKGMARQMCLAPEDATFRYFKLSVKDRKLEMRFHFDGQDFDKNYYGNAYNNLIIQNVTASAQAGAPSLVETASAKAFEIAALKEPEYWQNAQPVTE